MMLQAETCGKRSIRMEMTETDEFGQSHPRESKDLLTAKLKELDTEVSKIDKRHALPQAERKCPDQVETFKLCFLCCEVFHANVSYCLRLSSTPLFCNPSFPHTGFLSLQAAAK
jgi:hypothetical protein